MPVAWLQRSRSPLTVPPRPGLSPAAIAVGPDPPGGAGCKGGEQLPSLLLSPPAHLPPGSLVYRCGPVNLAMPLASRRPSQAARRRVGCWQYWEHWGCGSGAPSLPRSMGSGWVSRWWGPSAPPGNEGARARTLKLQALFSCFGSGVHRHTEGGGRRGRGGAAAAGGKRAPLPVPRRGPGALVGGVVGTALVPLHVPNAPDRLDLGVLSAEI